MNLVLYRNNAISCSFIVDSKTTVKRRLMVENTISVGVAVPKITPLDVRVGDYADIEGERYVVMDLPSYTLKDGVYDYSILLRGNLHRLEVYMMPDEGSDDWFYRGSVIDHINMVVTTLNTKEGGWSVALPELSKLADISPKEINYANISILSAFHAICSSENGWGLEFDVVGKMIKFAKEVKNPTTMCFEYGRGKGLYELRRGNVSSEKITTRLIGYGGKTNMPIGLRLNFADINNGNSYIENNVEQYGLYETRINFDHIFPRLKDASIVSDAVQIEVGKANWKVATALDFDLTQHVLEDAVIVFQTGDCVGVEFQIMEYNHTTKVLTFKESSNESGEVVYAQPNADRYPRAGDAFVLLNIVMPDSYAAAAKVELKQATTQELARLSVPQRSYTVNCDPRYFKAIGVVPLTGDTCQLIDAPHMVDYTSRIVEINYPLIDPYKVDLVLSDKISIPSGVVLSKSVNETKTKVASLERSQLTEEHLLRSFHPLGGRDDFDFKARELRGATLSLLRGGGGAGAAATYATMKFEPLVGTGAEPPAPSGGGGTFDYNELTNRPTIGGVMLTGDQTLGEYGLWNFGLATQSWVNTRFSSLPAWAMQPVKPSYAFTEITAKPTTLGGYGITDGLKLVRANAVNGNNVDWNTVIFDQDALTVSQIAPANYTGQTNYPFWEYGQLLTFGHLSSLFSSQIAISNSGILSFRAEYNSHKFTRSWKRVVTDDDSRLSNARPASDVYAWAKQSTKPSYQHTEIGNLAAASVNHANTAGNANTVNGSHAWRLQSVQDNGTPYGAGAYDIQSKYNAKGDYQFYLEVISPWYDPEPRLVSVGRAYDIGGYTAARLWRNDNANLTTVDWSCKKLTLAKFNAAGVATGSVTLTAKTF